MPATCSKLILIIIKCQKYFNRYCKYFGKGKYLGSNQLDATYTIDKKSLMLHQGCASYCGKFRSNQISCTGIVHFLCEFNPQNCNVANQI